jgi:hypothetical protein
VHRFASEHEQVRSIPERLSDSGRTRKIVADRQRSDAVAVKKGRGIAGVPPIERHRDGLTGEAQYRPMKASTLEGS